MLGVPKPQRHSLAAHPAFRLLLAFGMLALLFVIISRMSRPSSWYWWAAISNDMSQVHAKSDAEIPLLPVSTQVELAQAAPYFGWFVHPHTPGSLAILLNTNKLAEYLPLPESSTPSNSLRKSPFPDLKLLSGAADRKQFLTETFRLTDTPLPEKQQTTEELYRRDADARYHLLNLAKLSGTGCLESDGIRDFRYQALVTKPNEYRGKVLTITGSLNSIGESMEILRPGVGLEFCYPGMMMGDQPSHMYYLLFTDLPDNLPKDKTKWNQLFLEQVTFSGYFHKIVRMENHKEPAKPWFLPVIVGKMPRLPTSQANGPSSILIPFLIFLGMAIPVILILTVGSLFFRKQERRHQARIREVQRRRDERQPDWLV